MILRQNHETSSKTEYPQCSRRYPSYIFKRSIATGIIENTLLDWFFFISDTSNRKKEINHYLGNAIILALPVTKEQVWQLEQ